MVKTEYFIEQLYLSRKEQQVRIEFKRIPTKIQLEKAENQNKNGKKDDYQSIQTISMFSFSYPETRSNELDLNFNTIKFSLPLKDAHELGLKIGMVVLLDIPEEAHDIIIVNEKEPQIPEEVKRNE